MRSDSTVNGRYGSSPSRICVLIPTYNESASLPGVIERLRRTQPHLDLVVIDDGSPDGTGEIAQRIADHDPAVRVLHRASKQGLGAAYLAGFDLAFSDGYDAVIEFDADGSHLPEQVSRLVAAAADADVVIGSRWVPGGAIHHWPNHRRALSRGGNAYVRAALGIPVRDATAGLRLYRTDALRELVRSGVASQGYCFQVDLTLRAVDAGYRVHEVPIDFVEREQGQSKMNREIVVEALGRVTVWGARRRMRQLRSLGHRGVRGVLRARRGDGPVNGGGPWHHLSD